MHKQNQKSAQLLERHSRGSTLVIVIALLGLLAFTGMMFFTFAAQERTAAEFFSDAQKATIIEEDDVISFAVEQLITGAREANIHSALYSPTRRHSLVSNLVGNDAHPFTGSGVHIIYEDDPNTAVVALVPRVDLNHNGTADDEDGVPGTEVNTQGLLEFADSPALRAGLSDRGTLTPEPDVAYTYPDNNNLFLAYKGFAIRDNGVAANPQFEQVPVIIPSFFRPQYMKTTDTNGPTGTNVPTDLDWAADSEDPTALAGRTRNFMARSMRPHIMHRVFNRNGQSVARYLTDTEAAAPLINIGSGGFPFLPDNVAGGTATPGELGIWTGSAPTIMELDVDNDGDGVLEGIWMDLDYPIQEMTDSTSNTHLYTALHSMTVYDLDALINLNTHGNVALLPRSGGLAALAATDALGQGMVSSSNLGLGPNEVNPLYALRRDDRDFDVAPLPAYPIHHFTEPNPLDFPAETARPDRLFNAHFGRLPASSLEQANMEWIWLLTGRGNFVTAGSPNGVFPGRWGEADRLFNALRTGLEIGDLPRPGYYGNARQVVSNAVNFGGRGGYDDNQDSLEGEPQPASNIVRPFGHPMDFQGTGISVAVDYPQFDPNSSTFTYSRTPPTADQFAADDPRQPTLENNTATPGAGRWQSYRGYSVSSVMDIAFRRYMFGPNGVWDNGTGDDLSTAFLSDANFEDPLETIFFTELAQRPIDQIFSPNDLLALQISEADILKIKDDISLRIQELAPFAFAQDSSVRDRFTTLSNALRYIAMRNPFGGDMRPGIANVDDDLDGIVDEPHEALTAADVTDDPRRYWEFNTDLDNDGNLEFPPTFSDGNDLATPTVVVQAYNVDSTLTTPQDPFRPVVRRLLNMEVGERRSLLGQKPLSLNHLLDVDRNNKTPAEDSPEFLAYMQQAGLRLRKLTEHPHESTAGVLTQAGVFTLADPDGTPAPNPAEFTVLNESAVPFSGTDFSQQEFWARRDRQKMARDIFVMLYTTGGAEVASSFAAPHNRPAVKDYTRNNDPDTAVGSSTCLYTHSQLRRMAQFAVNLVDRLDADDVITRFEYDKNLGNGWNLDDDPYTNYDLERPNGVTTTTAATENGMYPEDTVDRGVVYGVEAQQLAFSEVLGVRSIQIPTDNHDATLHNDQTAGRDHLFLEIQNLLPSPVPLAQTGTTNGETAIWRIVRYDRFAASDPYATGNGNVTMYFKSNGDAVPADGTFTISTASDGTVISSDFFVDHNLDGTFELIAPSFDPVGTLPTTATLSVLTDPNAPELKPRCDLDMIHDDDILADRFGFLDANGDEAILGMVPKGYFLSTPVTPGVQLPLKPFPYNIVEYKGHTVGRRIQVLNDIDPDPLNPSLPGNTPHFGATHYTTGGEFGFDLVLQRRLHQGMPALKNSIAQNSNISDVNPWVEVDRINVVFRDFEIADGDVQTNLETDADLLLNIMSNERAEPLDDVTRRKFPVPLTPMDFVFNSVGEPINHNTDLATDVAPVTGVITLNPPGNTVVDGTGVFQLTQTHVDHDFATPGDLFAIPLFDGMLLTQCYNRTRLAPHQQVTDRSGVPDENLICGAAAMFLMPDFPNRTGDTLATSTARDNRWYRFLQLTEVPSRTHQMLGNYLAQNRLPGKLNINTIRHREVLAGLIDNPMFADTPPLLDKTPYYASLPPDPGNQFFDGPFLLDSTPGGGGDAWMRLIDDRDGLPVTGFDPVTASPRSFWIPGTPNAQPFTLASDVADVQLDFDGGGTDRVEGGLEDTVFRRSRLDIDEDRDGVPGDGIALKVDALLPTDTIPQQGATQDTLLTVNRGALEIGSAIFHQNPDDQTDGFIMGSGPAQRHQILSKILNNTTTVSNSFIVYVTAGYFECYEDPTTKLHRVGGRFDLDESGDVDNDIQREIFVIDRSELFSAYDARSGSLDWRKLVKYRVKVK